MGYLAPEAPVLRERIGARHAMSGALDGVLPALLTVPQHYSNLREWTVRLPASPTEVPPLASFGSIEDFRGQGTRCVRHGNLPYVNGRCRSDDCIEGGQQKSYWAKGRIGSPGNGDGGEQGALHCDCLLQRDRAARSASGGKEETLLRDKRQPDIPRSQGWRNRPGGELSLSSVLAWGSVTTLSI